MLVKSSAMAVAAESLVRGNQAALYATQKQAYGFVLAVSGILIVTVVGMSFSLSSSIATSLADLRDGARLVAAGHWLHTVEVRNHDELGQVARAFNNMTQALNNSYAKLEAEIDERQRALEELERSNADLEQFAYIASHDLKEPLRGLHNYAALLLEDYGDQLDDAGRAKLETLTRLTTRMEDLINSLLYYSRVGRMDLTFGETNLHEVVNEVISLLAVFLEEAHVEVRIPAPLPTICCDAIRVGEIFRNLITNAVQYNDKSQKWIEIGVIDNTAVANSESGDGNREQHAQALPVFYIRDNGIGIREKHQEAIFRISKRLHGRDKYGGGTGAGLTIVKKFVERHGGRIWVESSLGEGTTFLFTLQRESANRSTDLSPSTDCPRASRSSGDRDCSSDNRHSRPIVVGHTPPLNPPPRESSI